ISSSPPAQRSKFFTTASALKSVPSWKVTSSSSSNVYSKPSSDTSQSWAKPSTISVPSSSKSTIVSKIFFVTLNVSPSVVLDGSSEVESLPRPNINVPPSPAPSSAFSPSASALFPSLLPPEHAASTDPIMSSNKINKNFIFFTFTYNSLSYLVIKLG